MLFFSLPRQMKCLRSKDRGGIPASSAAAALFRDVVFMFTLH